MSGTWADLRRELHVEKARARALGHDLDVADCVEAVARWVGVPAPRRSPDDLLDEVLTLRPPRCICGTCNR